ncbi:MAG: hypothetical protein Kow0092_36430 [Deferrisomatales bacterium]
MTAWRTAGDDRSWEPGIGRRRNRTRPAAPPKRPPGRFPDDPICEEPFEGEPLAAPTRCPAEPMRPAGEEAKRTAEPVDSESRHVGARHAELYRPALRFVAGEQEPDCIPVPAPRLRGRRRPPELRPVCGAGEGPSRRGEQGRCPGPVSPKNPRGGGFGFFCTTDCTERRLPYFYWCRLDTSLKQKVVRRSAGS